MAVIKLPFPPTVNHVYGHNRYNSKPYIKPKGKQFRSDVITAVVEQEARYQANVPLRVEIVVFKDNDKSYDLDNLLKPLLDACTHAGVWVDDKLIDDLRIVRGDKSNSAYVLMEITAMDDVTD